jgi:HK97 family phage major capsid protein
MKWRAVELKLNKIFVLGEASSELVEDGVGYETQLAGSMSEATAYALDAGILYGNGVGQPLGVLNSPSAIQIDAESGQAADSVLYENLVNAYSRLAPACQKRAVWFVSPGVLPQMLTMTFPGSDNPVLLSGGQNDAASGAPALSIFGRPVVVTEIAPQLGDAGDIVFADLTQYALLMKRTARLEADAGPGFARDVMTWRMILRVSGQPMWNEPITPYGGGPTMSWATYLAPRS